MRRLCVSIALVAFCVASPLFALRANAMPPPFAALRSGLRQIAASVPAATAVEVLDLSTGYRVGFNADESMPAASTIKVPVMVEVFTQLEAGRFDLDRRVTLEARDKDYGSGDLCDAPVGSTYTVAELLGKMIDISDNTAANMLIRLVGRTKINRTMKELGLEHTVLHDDVRTASWSIRQELRTSPDDMVRLLAMMARRELVDAWSSDQMISILEEDEYNTLIPAGLPQDVAIAHKTGSLMDTLDDVGIVYAENAPYVMAVMTTGLPSLGIGRSYIHEMSHLAFRDELRLAQWRTMAGIDEFAGALPVSAPDVRYWQHANQDSAQGGGGG